MINQRLKDKVALVTGSSKGIGKAIAHAYLREGAQVIVNCRYVDEGRKALDELRAYGPCTFSAFDVADEQAVQQAFEKLGKEYGRLDVLVNNAGITRDKTLTKMKVEEWDEVIRTNLRGPYLCTQNAIKLMSDQSKGGSIINISSVIGLSGGFGQANYAASKAGLIGFTKSAALELVKKGVRVNAIAPGFIETDMAKAIPSDVLEKIIQRIPQSRLGKTEEVACLASYLASDESKYVTGQVFSINGGLYV